MLPSPSLACLTITCLSPLGAESLRPQLQGFSGSEKKAQRLCVCLAGSFPGTLSALCPEEPEPGEPGTPPSPGLEGPVPGHSGQLSPASRPRAARFRQTLCHTGSPNAPQKGKILSRFQMAFGLSIQRALPCQSLPRRKPSLCPPSPSRPCKLAEGQRPRATHAEKVLPSQRLPKAEGSAWKRPPPPAPTQTHHQRPGHHVQLHVQLKQVEDEEDNCHQPEEDSNEHDPAVGWVQVVRGIGNQGPHQQPQHLEGRDRARVPQNPHCSGWRPQGSLCRTYFSFSQEKHLFSSHCILPHTKPLPGNLLLLSGLTLHAVGHLPCSSSLGSRTFFCALMPPPASTHHPGLGYCFLPRL